MKRITNLFLAALVGFSALALGSCSKSENGKGPMEKAGEAIKEAGEKMQESGKAEQKQ